jgi:hypothetical protein
MKQLERRQLILIGIVVVLVLGFGLWKFVLSGGGGSSAVEQPTTATSVATAQVDPNNPAATSGTSAPAGGGQTTPPSTAYVDVPFDPHAYRNPFVPAG